MTIIGFWPRFSKPLLASFNICSKDVFLLLILFARLRDVFEEKGL